MTNVLSQEEIDQLLTAINKGNTEPEDYKPVMIGKKIKIYDFKRPDKFSKEQIRNISIIHETFARLTTNSLSAQLRSMAYLQVASVDQLTYEEYIRSIPTPTTLATINMAPLKGYAVMEIDPAITFAIIDRICGGVGEGTKSQHELTDIELSIMENIIIRIIANLREAWTMVFDLCPCLEAIDTNPQFAQIVPPNEMVVMLSLETMLGGYDVKGLINICIPYSTVEPIIEKLSALYWYCKKQNVMPLIPSKNLKLNDKEDIPVRLTAEILNRDYPVKEIWKWDIGTVILPLCLLNSGYCYLRLGYRRVWQCQILPDSKWLPKRIKIVNFVEKPFETEGNDMKIEEGNSLVADALSNAKIKITAELGATSKTVKEVFAIGEGTILELDKLAGEPVDVKANGVLIAYGEVVVIDENFGVRITEIAGAPKAPDQSGQQQPVPKQPDQPGPKVMEEAAELTEKMEFFDEGEKSLIGNI
jgi:flagellar motor switch protein FliM